MSKISEKLNLNTSVATQSGVRTSRAKSGGRKEERNTSGQR